MVPLPDMRIKYMNILRLMVFQNQMSFLLRLSVLVVGASGESPLKEDDEKHHKLHLGDNQHKLLHNDCHNSHLRML